MRMIVGLISMQLTVLGLVSFAFLVLRVTCLDVQLATALRENPLTVRTMFGWFHLWIYVMFFYFVIIVVLQLCWGILRTKAWKNYEALPLGTPRMCVSVWLLLM